MRALIMFGALLALPGRVQPQTASDSTAVVTFIVVTVKELYGRQVAPNTEARKPPEPVSDASVALKGGPELGTTSDSGTVTIFNVPAGRQDFVFRAKDHRQLACRVRVQAGREQVVDVHLLPERGVAAWMPFGCRPRG